MNIRFQGNYVISGPTQAGVSQEVGQLDAASTQLGLGIVIGAAPCSGDSCDPNAQFAGILLTDNDAVDFLKEQGLTNLDTTRPKAAIEADAVAFLTQKFNLPSGQQAYNNALAEYAYTQRFVHGNGTEKELAQ